MRKIALAIVFVLITIVGINTYNKDSEKEVSQITFSTNDIKKDYENIVIKKGNENEKLIALTFDDGPDEDFSPQILDILNKYNAKATFFVVGEKVGWHPEIVKRAYSEGHEIGNHTFTHINVEKNSENIILKEIEKTQQAIKDVIGIEPVLFRPPYRAISSVYNIVKTIEEKAHNGSIVLLHDYNTIRNSKSQTIQALEQIIPEMQSKGYKFVTVSEIIEDKAAETEKR